MQVASAAPYNITTGVDDNVDTVFNDRPGGVERNSGRGASQVNANLRLNKSFGFGGCGRRARRRDADAASGRRWRSAR